MMQITVRMLELGKEKARMRITKASEHGSIPYPAGSPWHAAGLPSGRDTRGFRPGALEAPEGPEAGA